jgi:hypothetical protein
MVVPRLLLGRWDTSGSVDGPSSRRRRHSAGRWSDLHMQSVWVSVCCVQGAAPWLSSVTMSSAVHLPPGRHLVSGLRRGSDPKPLRDLPRRLADVVCILRAAPLHHGDEVNHIPAAARGKTEPALVRAVDREDMEDVRVRALVDRAGAHEPRRVSLTKLLAHAIAREDLLYGHTSPDRFVGQPRRRIHAVHPGCALPERHQNRERHDSGSEAMISWDLAAILPVIQKGPTWGARLEVPTRGSSEDMLESPDPHAPEPPCAGPPVQTPSSTAPSHAPADRDPADRSTAWSWPAAPATTEWRRRVGLGVPTLGQNPCRRGALGVHAADTLRRVVSREHGRMAGGEASAAVIPRLRPCVEGLQKRMPHRPWSAAGSHA